MAEKGDTPGAKNPAERRKERLAAELRANLQRRKQQTRARRQGDMDATSGLPAAKGEKPAWRLI
ncbi:MAG: hypothetical protein AAF724_20455 [Pseudomonadota bacterium]